MEADIFHKPVLVDEVIKYLITKPNGTYFDGTLGGGGYSKYILEKLSSEGKLLSTDLDLNAIEYCKKLFQNEKRITILHENYKNILKIMAELKIEKLDGAVLDLGVSSFQLDNASSGFSYRQDVKFDQRFDTSSGITSAELLNKIEEKNLAKILFEYGEEKKAKIIAKKIIEFRNKEFIATTSQVKHVLESIIPKHKLNETLSRVFQAIRIYINDELGNLKSFLEAIVQAVTKNGRIVIVSYHSLEDRIVKEFFNFESVDCVCPKDVPVWISGKVARIKKINK
ncbi:MAG: 16S rRNA (cytosine(1402)-N(4))-methyltransferase RsmH, partial [Ignavibacteria bacterium]|nr:16S rRNA (cytosine(1402)-N(4))-methyltransferase RsmH [Ignavibacteria bacterium]